MKSENTPEKFVEYLYKGLEAWEKAGKILVDMIKHNPQIKSKILRDHPEISMSILNKLELVGSGMLEPSLLLSDSAPFKAARKLTPSDQRNLIDNKEVALVVYTESGVDEINADFEKLSAKQTKQVFAGDHIRTPSEQRLYLESSRKRIAKDWEFENGLIVFRRGCKLTISQMNGIIQEVMNNSAMSA